MKKIIFIMLMFVLVGCSVGKEKLETYIDEPENIIKDPHFTSYKEKLDALESEYLKKKITYAEYLDRKKELDDTYAKEVKERSEKIIPPNY